MKKYIKYIIIAALIAGLIWTKGDLFKLIDIVIVCPIANILFFIYNIIGDFGSAIILFTILVKLLTWPLTKSQLRQTKLMRKIQPELAAIRKNCNGNKQLESIQTLDLYKRYNLKPLRSILTLVIQLPIFIALYTAIRVMVLPVQTDNLATRAYSIVQYEGSRISDVVAKQESYLADTTNNVYDFHPQLFGIVPLDGVANSLLRGEVSLATIFALICAVVAAFMQYFVAKQQQPSDNSKKKKFRDLLKEAESGKELEQNDITAMTTGQMTTMMPIMMFLIMFNLPGALALYYLLNNAVTILQQKVVFSKSVKEMDDMTDKTILKELKNIQEAEVITNKKTGTKITRISAKDNKKKRR